MSDTTHPTDEFAEVWYEHFATCLGTGRDIPALRDETDATYAVTDCTAHWSASQYPKWSDLKAAYFQHIRETGHLVHVGQFARITLKEPS